MEDTIGVTERCLQQGEILNTTLDTGDTVTSLVQILGFSAGKIVNDHDFMRPRKRIYEVGPDKTRSSGYNVFHSSARITQGDT
jgi:hypothetical protein